MQHVFAYSVLYRCLFNTISSPTWHLSVDKVLTFLVEKRSKPLMRIKMAVQGTQKRKVRFFESPREKWCQEIGILKVPRWKGLRKGLVQRESGPPAPLSGGGMKSKDFHEEVLEARNPKSQLPTRRKCWVSAWEEHQKVGKFRKSRRRQVMKQASHDEDINNQRVGNYQKVKKRPQDNMLAKKRRASGSECSVSQCIIVSVFIFL